MTPAELKEITVRTLGACARTMVTRDGRVAVLGTTSKGAFLQDEGGTVCFLSQEVWRGPLTLNLREEVRLKDVLQVGMVGRLIGERVIDFPACRITVHEEADIWAPEPIDLAGFHPTEARRRGRRLARRMDWTDSIFQTFSTAFVEGAWTRAEQTLQDLTPGQGELPARLAGLLGLGAGLTPSGDDFLCGWLLARHSLRGVLPASGEGEIPLTGLVELARARTTALSASLMACAAEGQADERLIQALAWLLSGAGAADKISEALHTYGSASGSDALSGMLASLIWMDEME